MSGGLQTIVLNPINRSETVTSSTTTTTTTPPKINNLHVERPPLQRPPPTASSVSDRPTLRRSSSIWELKHLILHKIPDKFFKRSNQSEIFLPTTVSSAIPNQIHDDHKTPLDSDSMRKNRPTGIGKGVPSQPAVVPSKDQSTVGRMDWAPDFSPISFSPTLSVDIRPLSPPNSPPPPSRCDTTSTFRRKFSLRSAAPTTPTITSDRRSSASRGSISTAQTSPRSHERRRSKYLNDPTVLSMLDRKFEDALELGFASPPPTPHNRSPSPNNVDPKRSPITPSVDGTTIVGTIEETDEDEDIFSRPTPDLALPTLKELDDGEWKDGQGNVMTLRLTLTPATCLTEVEEAFPLDVTTSTTGLGKRMSGLGRILSRTRSRKVRI